MDHLHLGLTATGLLNILSGGVGTLELEVVATTDGTAVLADIALPKDWGDLADLQVEGVGDELVTGEGVLESVRFNSRASPSSGTKRGTGPGWDRLACRQHTV